jgi:peptidyl-prolyl cis-trans isomerase D
MATLEKIRRRSVLLLIIIAVALLAFIVGDALTNSRNIFGNRTTVAEVGGTKIDYMDYQNKRSELNDRLEQQRKYNPNMQNYDSQMLAQAALQELVGETLLSQAVDKLGIVVTGDQLRFYMLENPINQNLGTLIQQLNASNIAVQTPEQAYKAIFQPQTVGKTDADMAGFKNYWLQLENETKTLVAQQSYVRLLQGTFVANDLDKKLIQEGYATVSDITYAMVPYGQLDEKKYPVSDADIKAAYDRDKNRYRVDEPTKTISFINVAVAPSQKDLEASQKLALKTVAELAGNGTLSKETKKAGVTIARQQLRGVDIKEQNIKDFVATATADTVRIISNDIKGFTAVKMGSRTAERDSIKLNIVAVAGKTLPAKVLAQLNGGLAIDSVAKKFSADSVNVTKEQWFPLFTAQGRTDFPQNYLDSLAVAGGRYIALDATDEGTVYAKIVEEKAPVTIYEYDLVTYNLQPSNTTMQAAQSKLNKFLETNNTADKFVANAAKAGYTVSTYDVSQSTPAIPIFEGMNQYLPDSRQVIRWVMIDASKGDVSHIYESKDVYAPKLYAAAVTDEFEDYYPVNHRHVKESLTDKVRRQKAGDAMVKTYSAKGTTVSQIAAAMNATPQEAQVRFSVMGARPIADAAVVGKIAGSKQGGKATVVRGDNGVYVYQVNKITKENLGNDQNGMFEQQFMQFSQFARPNLLDMLIGKDKVKNYIYKFEAGE